MGAYCSKAPEELCGHCSFTCSCTTCAGTGGEAAAACDCSCRFMVVCWRFHPCKPLNLC